ncbi:hypothetical protein ES705_08096 [subsurface metagenome]
MLNKKILTLIFVVAFVTLLIGCLAQPTNQVPVITSIPITAVEVGETYTYYVNATDPDGDTLAYTLALKPKGMTINSATGLVKWTPTKIGNYHIIVKVSDGDLDITQSFTIVVSDESPGYTPPCPTPVTLTKIVVVPKVMTLFVKQSETIVSVTAHYSDGTTFVIDQPGYDYGNGSDDDSVAEVSVSHVVTAVTEGTATITVMYEDKTDTIAVTVKAILLDSIVVDPDKMDLKVGDREPFTVTAHYNDESTADIDLRNCSYESSDPLVATVVASRTHVKVVSANGVGTATITVKYGGIEDTIEVEVSEPPIAVTGVTLEPTTLTITGWGVPGILVATIIPANATNKSVIWDSSDPTVASVLNGQVTSNMGGRTGTTTITVTTADGGFTDTCLVTVEPVLPPS